MGSIVRCADYAILRIIFLVLILLIVSRFFGGGGFSEGHLLTATATLKNLGRKLKAAQDEIRELKNK